jgi:Rieske Fe-S protein
MTDAAPPRPRRSLPLWREEVSIHAAEERYVSRRQFGKFLVLASFGMFVGNLWILVRARLRGEPDVLPAARIARLSEMLPGEVRLFSYPGPEDGCILVRARDGSLRAYSQKCTHLSCAVYYSKKADRLECPCHDGAFSVYTGAVLHGPPPRPLPRVLLETRGDEIYAVGLSASAEQV